MGDSIDADLARARLRSATPADAHAVTACVAAAYAKWVPRLGRRPWPMQQDYAAVIADRPVVVAEAGDAVVGVLVVATTPEGFLIENVAVQPEEAGKGFGRLLLQDAERQAAAQGHPSLYLYTNEKMTENIALYRRIGFAVFERREEDGFCRVFMRKALR